MTRRRHFRAPLRRHSAGATACSDQELQTKIQQGYVEHGWQPQAWAARLRQLADRCESMHPDRAAELRQWADNVDRRANAPATGA